MGVPDQNVVKPLRVHEFDNQAIDSICFEPNGLIVAEREGRLVGFVHAGFGPELPIDPAAPTALARSMGSIVMLVVEPVSDAYEIAMELVLCAERYLASRGAEVLYAGSQYPLNPFYWGLYGGSEAAGVPSSHFQFASALTELGYEPVSTAVHLHFDLQRPDPRDPRAGIHRRQLETVFEEDPIDLSWWEALALGDFHPLRVGLRSRADGVEVARAFTWDMTWFGRDEGRPRLGVFGVEVHSMHRRKGYARFLFGEIVRHARERGFLTLEVQALADNEPAMSFYQAVDFEPVEQSTVFRLPAPFPDRSRP